MIEIIKSVFNYIVSSKYTAIILAILGALFYKRRSDKLEEEVGQKEEQLKDLDNAKEAEKKAYEKQKDNTIDIFGDDPF